MINLEAEVYFLGEKEVIIEGNTYENRVQGTGWVDESPSLGVFLTDTKPREVSEETGNIGQYNVPRTSNGLDKIPAEWIGRKVRLTGYWKVELLEDESPTSLESPEAV